MPFIDSKVSVKTTPDHMYIKYAASREWGWNGSNF